MNQFQAYSLHQSKVRAIIEQCTGDEEMTVYSGCYEKHFVTILKVNDNEYKFNTEITA